MTAGESAAEAHPGSLADHWILNKLSILTEEINEDIDNFRFSEAYQALYHFVWDDLADWYVEASKAEPNRELLKYVLEASLMLLHPLAPFITEAIWRQLGHEDLLAAQTLPKILAADKEAADKFEQLQQIITEARHLISVTGAKKPNMTYRQSPLLAEQAELVARLGRLGGVSQSDGSDGLKLLRAKDEIRIEIDKSAAQAYSDKLAEQRRQRQASIDRLKQRLDNKSYVENAPKELVDETRQNLADEVELLKQLEEEISAFQASQN
jgi:valyl-tRNA synthetase